jgi:hypothetical protein
MFSVYCNGTLIGTGVFDDCIAFVELRKNMGAGGYYVIDPSTGEVMYE